MIMGVQLFVSYARRDLPFVRDLVEWLRSEGFDTWLDLTRLKAGQAWSPRIAEGISASSHFLVVVSPYAMRSQDVRDEVELAFQSGRTIVPLLLQQTEIPVKLAAIQWVDFRVSFHRGCEELAARLHNRDTQFLRAIVNTPQRQPQWLGWSPVALVPSPVVVRGVFLLISISVCLKWLWMAIAIMGASLRLLMAWYVATFGLPALVQFATAIRAVHRRITLWEIVVSQLGAVLTAPAFLLPVFLFPDPSPARPWHFLTRATALTAAMDGVAAAICMSRRTFRRWMIAYPYGWGFRD
jgi:TIR domain